LQAVDKEGRRGAVRFHASRAVPLPPCPYLLPLLSPDSRRTPADSASSDRRPSGLFPGRLASSESRRNRHEPTIHRRSLGSLRYFVGGRHTIKESGAAGFRLALCEPGGRGAQLT